MFERGSCVRVHDVPFAEDKVRPGCYVRRQDPETGEYRFYRIEEAPPLPGSHYINTDTIEPVECQVTGKWFDSKSALRAHYKEIGVVEVAGCNVGKYRECKTEPIQQTMKRVMEKYETSSAYREEIRQKKERGLR